MKKTGSARDPLWFKDAIIYETHVRAFHDSNNDGIGDFQGLIQKLDYLHHLGITCLWLLPFFPSPLRDDGYDIADYLNVHPSYGTLDDFKAFVKAAHERDIQVIIELVINHTSDQHPWFQAARKAPPGSPARDFYVWSDTDRKYRDARIIFTDTEISNWTWSPEAGAYYWHRFFSHQPDLNFDNPAVLREVIGIMRFWLDLGVDGLRLDAIPYLIERDGTNCENLPETHVVLKAMRQALDADYANRVFLAEANQWPTDVRPYFGEGDECHMAFHFPLMPRMFMALRLEDRHPITEIMAQTPEIPSACQWGLFLRNHDELTLEMVTDEERDYMYFAYSADPQARLNVGIRRRLAPLMENNRRRIELLNGLLLSFPGTPIIYYGDEIGMGDNIYLGDRNGVRTPMQWNADRNAGFSRVTPAKLYSPIIMDPVFGYEAINVEAQQGDPSSLLSWMRNLIALRKLFKLFGRGAIEFLHPANRKVLAYLREHENDRVLCVANLSRFAQPARLDLSRFDGMIPVEMLGYTEFPPIERSPYAMTLAPYAFHWFELRGTPPAITLTTDDAGVAPTPEWTLEGRWDALFEEPSQGHLERALPRFLVQQRWFGGKARQMRAVRIEDTIQLARSPSPAWITILDVEYGDGGREAYVVPLTILAENESQGASTPAEAVVGRIKNANGVAVLCDAMRHDAVVRALLGAVRRSLEIQGERGTVRAFQTPAFARVAGRNPLGLKPSYSTAEQSNTSIRFGQRLMFKLFRRLEPGPNPELEIGQLLTGRFARVPALAGALEYRGPGHVTGTIGVLQELVANQGDGWKFALEELDRYFERTIALPPYSPDDLPDVSISELSGVEPTRSAREAIGLYLDAATTLGRRTAELHLALAGSEDPAFVPEPMLSDELAQLADQLAAHADRVFAALSERRARLPEDAVDQAALILTRRRRILERFRQLGRSGIRTVKTRVHGDYHLGQVLTVENDFTILDFEGEPARTLDERRAKQSPMKDVAGMLRSFSYAARVSQRTRVTRRPDDLEPLERWTLFWERWISAVFLRAYRSTAGDASFLPGEPEHLEQLLGAFVLDKALYELHYELNNRPDWLPIPLGGILSLSGGWTSPFRD